MVIANSAASAPEMMVGNSHSHAYERKCQGKIIDCGHQNRPFIITSAVSTRSFVAESATGLRLSGSPKPHRSCPSLLSTSSQADKNPSSSSFRGRSSPSSRPPAELRPTGWAPLLHFAPSRPSPSSLLLPSSTKAGEVLGLTPSNWGHGAAEVSSTYSSVCPAFISAAHMGSRSGVGTIVQRNEDFIYYTAGTSLSGRRLLLAFAFTKLNFVKE